MSDKYYLLGEKLKHSYSSLIHRRRGYDYELKELPLNKLGEFILAKNYKGLNVTVPYKTEVIKYLDEVESSAAKIGAVNTVVNDGGKLYGYNTDVSGLAYTLKKADIHAENKNVLILGSGGAAKTARVFLSALGAAEITTVSRTGEVNYQNCYSLAADTQIVINCTPVGTYPFDENRPVDLSRFPQLSAVVDLTYNPSRTELILQAESLGVRAVNGLYMLVAQAYNSENLFDGREARENEIDSEVNRIRRETDNIILVGASGAGKSTVGKILGAYTGREVVDTDDCIERNYKLSPEDIIIRYGEDYFRQIEELAVNDACQRRGVIIVAGGGAVEVEKNCRAIRRCGKVIWLDRSVDELTDEHRPVAKRVGAKKLYEMRRPLYSAVCDIKLRNDKPENCAKEILKLI